MLEHVGGLCDHALAIVGMQDVQEEVGAGRPVLGRVAEHLRRLRADVEARRGRRRARRCRRSAAAARRGTGSRPQQAGAGPRGVRLLPRPGADSSRAFIASGIGTGAMREAPSDGRKVHAMRLLLAFAAVLAVAVAGVALVVVAWLPPAASRCPRSPPARVRAGTPPRPPHGALVLARGHGDLAVALAARLQRA